MMQDFDRTMELVNISANSYGATLAQSGEYTEGLEAATNRLTNAWETFVTSIVQSDIVISVINGLTNTIKFITDNMLLLIPLTSLLLLKAISILATKIAEHRIDKDKYKLALQEQKQKLKDRQLELLSQRDALISYKQALLELKTQGKITKEKIDQAIMDAEKTGNTELENKALALAAEHRLEGAALDKEIQETDAAIAQKNLEIAQITGQIRQNAWDTAAAEGGISGGIAKILQPLGTIISVLTTIITLRRLSNTLQQKGTELTNRQTKAEEKGFLAKLKNAGAKMAQSAAEIPIAGWVIALAILGAIVGLTVAGISAAKNSGSDAQAEKTDEDLKKLEADLFNLKQSQQKVAGLADEFENLSNKIVKTSEDAERLKEIAQSINDEAGREVVDISKPYEEQLKAVKGYQAAQKAEIDANIQAQTDRINEGLKKIRKNANAWRGVLTALTPFGLGAISFAGSKQAIENEQTEYKKTILDKQSGQEAIKAGMQQNISVLGDTSAETVDAVFDIFKEN